jgi:hypothetical protein
METQLPKGVDSLRPPSRLDLVSFRNEAGGKRKERKRELKQVSKKSKERQDAQGESKLHFARNNSYVVVIPARR